MANEFIGSGGLLQGILNPQGVNFQPLAAGIQRSVQQGREDDLRAEQEDLRDNAAFGLSIFGQPVELRQQALAGQMAQALQSGDTENAQEIQQLMQMDGPTLESALKDVIFQGAKFLPAGALQGAGLGQQRSGLASAKTETYPNGTVLQALPNGTTQVVAPNGVVVTDPNERIKVLEAAEASGVARGTNIARGKAVGTAEGQASTSEIAATTAGKIEAAKEKGKQEQQLNFRPRIQKAIARSKSAGDDEEKLAALKANTPLVNDMADKLRALSSDATHTFGGRAFDFLAKESGFGATKGSTARAKYQAIIDNQVLPLLKATFGAAFTAAEGQRLAATLGDVNAAPAEKMAQLDAFLDSQQSQITGLERKLNPEAADANVGDLSDEDLFN